MLRKTASAIATCCLENSMAKHFPEPNSLKERMHESPFIPFEPILPLSKSTTRKLPFTFVKTNDHYPSWASLSLFPLAPRKLFLTTIEIQLCFPTMNLLRWRIDGPWNFVRLRLWSPMKRIPHMSMRPSSLKYHAHSMQLQSQACLVHRAHTRTTTTLWSSSVKLSGGWL